MPQLLTMPPGSMRTGAGALLPSPRGRPRFMPDGVWEIFQGLFGIILALFLWRATHNWWGWLALWLPGSAFILYGIWKAWKSR